MLCMGGLGQGLIAPLSGAALGDGASTRQLRDHSGRLQAVMHSRALRALAAWDVLSVEVGDLDRAGSQLGTQCDEVLPGGDIDDLGT